MDWANFDHRIPSRSPVSDKDRETVLRVAEEAIMKTDLDPEIVLNAAARALGNASFVGNLRAYAKQAIFRALKRTGLAHSNKDPLANSEALTDDIDFAVNGDIENIILIRDLLETLDIVDQEIVRRRMNGETFPQIDKEMALRPRTAESRFNACKKMLEKALSKKAGLRKRACGL
jgi:hypothetical protein